MTKRRLFALTILAVTVSWAAAQDKSVKPGINDPFKDPNLNLQEWISRFERESRETYDKRREITAACQLRPGMTVADVGAGTGLFTRLFAAEVGDKGTVYAVDIAPKFLDYINESAKKAGLKNIKTVLGTDTSAELPRGAIDLVFICDTYHHFEYPERMLKSIHEALKPGGRMVVVDFIREEGKSRQWILDHVRAGQAVVEKEIQTAGFKKIGEVKDLLNENYLIIFEKPAVSTAPSRNGSDK